jgi:hypothetical protein
MMKATAHNRTFSARAFIINRSISAKAFGAVAGRPGSVEIPLPSSSDDHLDCPIGQEEKPCEAPSALFSVCSQT